MTNVSWNDAKQYVGWLSKLTGKMYRLLSEAEWEYAARARTTITGESLRFSFGDDEDKLKDYAWYRENSGSRTQEVGKKQSNAFGLHDMYGNVWEWVEDCWHENYNDAPSNGSAWMGGECHRRVLRGSSWFNTPGNVRSAVRDGASSGSRNFVVGFRIARTLRQ